MKAASVITGDLVASRQLTPGSRKKIYRDLEIFLKDLQKKKWITRFEMFRGDSLQCLVGKKEQALRVALMIKAFTNSYKLPVTGKKKPGKTDIRLSIGTGKVNFLKSDSLAHSDGEAFYLSGAGLDQLKGASFRMIVTTGNSGFNASIEPSILLMDAILQKWTPNQAETVLYKLKNMKEEDIARHLGISQSAVNQRTKSAHWFAIEKLVDYFEKTIKDW